MQPRRKITCCLIVDYDCDLEQVQPHRGASQTANGGSVLPIYQGTQGALLSGIDDRGRKLTKGRITVGPTVTPGRCHSVPGAATVTWPISPRSDFNGCVTPSCHKIVG